MDKPVNLIALVCPNCSTPVPAQPDEVAWVCTQCGKGFLLDQVKGLVLLEVNYSSAIAPSAKGKPYWVAEGRVTLQRESYGFGSSTREAQAFWSQPRRFFIPAYSCPMETMLNEGIQRMAWPPVLQSGPACPFEPVTEWLEDVQAFAEFVLVAIEAGRKDKLKEIKFSLELSSPSLWILPDDSPPSLPLP